MIQMHFELPVLDLIYPQRRCAYCTYDEHDDDDSDKEAGSTVHECFK